MNITLNEADAAEMKKAKSLYLGAFPKEERAPFWLLKRRAKQGRARMIFAGNGGLFAGFAYIVENADCAYLFYFAIVPEMRGSGCGTEILSRLRGLYKDKRLFLARETLDPAADNYEQRVRRHKFYLRCGFEDIDRKIREGKVTYDVMSVGGDVSPEDYGRLINRWLGGFLSKFTDMKII